MAKFVLIHGMFHGGWCWDLLLPKLAARGHSAIAPNLAGCAGDPTPPELCTLERWAGDVAGQIMAQDEPMILVGHSRGGLVASQVAENAAEKVAATVYLTAVMLPDGAAMATMGDLLTGAGHSDVQVPFPVGFSEDGQWLLPADPDEWFHEGYSEADAAWSRARIAPEPSSSLTAPLHLTAERYGRISRFYIETLRDKILPIGTQRAMIELGGPVERYTLDTGHMPNVTGTDELAMVLDEIARRVG